MSRFLITGGQGMLAYAIKTHPYFEDHQAFGSKDFNLTNVSQMASLIDEVKPDIVINCAAYTDVTKAEQDKETAYAVNAQGVKNLADLTQQRGIKLVHISTDFVFLGNEKISRTPDEIIHPVNVYGASKAEGENLLKQSSDNWLIIRVSWLYGPHGRNFVSLISRLMREKSELKIVEDQFGKTTYTRDAADFMALLLDKDSRGIYHIANDGPCSRYEFTCEIKDLLAEREEVACRILPIHGYEYPDPTPRPFWSVLDTVKTEDHVGRKIRHWKEALRAYLSEESENA